jgi:SAM-dependent methyltransferase
MECPLCNSRQVKQIINQPSWQIWSCKTCTNAWTLPSPSEINYEEADFHGETVGNKNFVTLNSFDDLSTNQQICIKKQIYLLTQHLYPGAKILEIGCGEGIFLEELSKSGFLVKGLEPSLTASERAKQKGLDVIQGYFPHPKINENFDAVVMSHVLEHTLKPLEVLQEIAKIAPKGILFLIQTHYKGLYPRLAHDKWYWAHEQHYWHFTPNGIIRIASELSPNIHFQKIACEFSSLTRNPQKFPSSKGMLVAEIASLLPPLEDQFHLLLKIKTN